MMKKYHVMTKKGNIVEYAIPTEQSDYDKPIIQLLQSMNHKDIFLVSEAEFNELPEVKSFKAYMGITNIV